MKRGGACVLMAGFVLGLVAGCGGGPKNVSPPSQSMDAPKDKPFQAGMGPKGNGK
jgi:hypothetical protein